MSTSWGTAAGTCGAVLRRLAAVVFALCLLPVGAATAQAQENKPKPEVSAPDPQAVLHFDRGMALFKRGEFRAALTEFEASYQISRTWKVLVHIGLTRGRLVQYKKALIALGRYLEDGGEAIDANEREALQREMKTFRSMLAAVTVMVKGGPAEVLVGDETVGTSPLKAPLLLDPGKHTVRARREGFDTAEQALDLAAGAKQEVVLTLMRQTGTLRVSSRPGGARLLVGGQEVGPTPWEGRLPARAHRIELRLAGHQVGRTKVILEPNRTRQLSVTLTLLPPPPSPPWYKRWYVWAGVGAVVTAAVVVGVVVGTRPSYEERVWVPKE